VVRLNRLVRFSINDQPPAQAGMRNGYSGAPAMVGLGRHYEVLIVCTGEIHPLYSYLIDIKAVDRAVRECLIPVIGAACSGGGATQSQATGTTRLAEGISPHSHPAHVLRSCLPALNHALGGLLHSARWFLNPTFSIEVAMTPNSQPMPGSPSRPGMLPAVALLRQKFEFAAAHRLHVPSLSQEENLRLFGKCTWTNGHGHNYHVEPCVAITLDDSGAHPLTLARLEEIVDEALIKPFDHKNLNLDTEQFADGKGLNPSVENIAKVFFGILAPRVSREIPGAELREITVWESDRTSSTFPG
jgi:6-pyruvoyltetrahydropterin/6-carboxytetrahydropterin synthase